MTRRQSARPAAPPGAAGRPWRAACALLLFAAAAVAAFGRHRGARAASPWRAQNGDASDLGAAGRALGALDADAGVVCCDPCLGVAPTRFARGAGGDAAVLALAGRSRVPAGDGGRGAAARGAALKAGERVLVTGGAGFIGSSVVRALQAAGLRAEVLDDLSAGRKEWLPEGVGLVEADVRNASAVSAAAEGAAAVVHLAAMSRVLPSVQSGAAGVRGVLDANVLGTASALQAAAGSATVRRFLYAGSSTYYGSQALPNSEADPFVPSSPYALSKYDGELLVTQFAREYGLPAATLRLFQVYGGVRQHSAGPLATVEAAFVRAAAQGLPLLLEGSGEQSRDFVHVEDVADAFVKALTVPDAGGRLLGGGAINVGSGCTRTIASVAAALGQQARLSRRPPRRMDLNATCADTCRARRRLGWAPAVGFAEALRADAAAASVPGFLQEPS